MFEVNNKNTRAASYFTPLSSVFIVDFEQVNVSSEGDQRNNSLNLLQVKKLQLNNDGKRTFRIFIENLWHNK